MQTVVGIRFKKAGKIYYFDPGQLALAAGENVIVETARGLEYGEVVIAPRQIKEEDIVAPLKPVHRKATTQLTRKRSKKMSQRKQKLFEFANKKLQTHGLPMNLVDVEYTFDVNKIIFYFTAEGRIDFRELGQRSGSRFSYPDRTAANRRPDEAKMVGGIGCCGRPLCCSTFLGRF